ncbi:MAG: polymer-forming cytoskeletal protein [Bacteroidales bacterium]|jgi:cytoskeletal protein CcmA (bactofilin family)|nr:polymer-forming cytoskeletal protein [Bacteroidales bacterium]
MAKKETQVVDTNAHNQLINGTIVKGDIISNGNFKVDGKVIGTITSENRVVIGETGVVEGEIKSNSIQIFGNVQGFVHCDDILVLKPTSVVVGDIKTKKLVVEIGAVFSGNCDMVVQNTKGKEENSKK